MECETCKTKIDNGNIFAAGKDFCSDICHLRFWKNEMPNLGGQWITDRSIAKVESLEGEARKEEYNRISLFILNNMNSTPLMRKIRYGRSPEDDDD